jgi:hypothetical protein
VLFVVVVVVVVGAWHGMECLSYFGGWLWPNDDYNSKWNDACGFVVNDDFFLLKVSLTVKLFCRFLLLPNTHDTTTGGGPRERVFWNNYFFHCAFTRYEAGLSIDEIWSYQQASTNNNDEAATGAAGTVSFNSMGNTAGGGGGVGSGAPTSTQQQQQEEETVDFDGTPNNPSSDPTFVEFGDNDNSGDGGVTNEMDGGIGGLADSTSAAAASTAASDFAVGNDFELVDEDDGGVLDGTSGDPELDELEAEIARELEGL